MLLDGRHPLKRKHQIFVNQFTTKRSLGSILSSLLSSKSWYCELLNMISVMWLRFASCLRFYKKVKSTLLFIRVLNKKKHICVWFITLFQLTQVLRNLIVYQKCFIGQACNYRKTSIKGIYPTVNFPVHWNYPLFWFVCIYYLEYLLIKNSAITILVLTLIELFWVLDGIFLGKPCSINENSCPKLFQRKIWNNLKKFLSWLSDRCIW